jgi:uncharacterized membrane protein (UPF0136 family)
MAAPKHFEECMFISLLATWSLLVMAVVVAVGGFLGFVKAKSKASLIAGWISGVLYVAALLLSGKQEVGFTFGAVLSVALCVVFGIRLKKTGKFMPAGVMLICCALETALLGVALFVH